MVSDKTAEQIKAEILAIPPEGLGTSEGDFTNTLVSGVALSLWQFYQRLNSLEPILWVDETSGIYLEKTASESGIIRKSGTRAQVVLRFSGTTGTVIAMGTVFATDSGLEFITKQTAIIGEDGTAEVEAEAEEVGAMFNLGADKITVMIQSMAGVSGVSNPLAASGGNDMESDASLYLRLCDRRQRPATSGNSYHYRQWALETPGVGECRVFPRTEEDATTYVILADNNKGPVSAEIVATCAAHIEDSRPIGARVLVSSAEGFVISVVATIEVDGSVSLEAVKTAFAETLGVYFRSVSLAADKVIYHRCGLLLLSIDGVRDYTSFTLNGAETNIALARNQVPVLGNLEVLKNA